MTAQAEVKTGKVTMNVRRIELVWDGKLYSIDRETVVKAFYEAPLPVLKAPQPRYFLEVDKELKNPVDVWGKIVTVKEGSINEEALSLIVNVFRVLGFEVLDRREHYAY